jgi:acetyl esterase/lipase
MKKSTYLILIFGFYFCNAKAQNRIDTSYTVQSTFAKDRKKFPFIQISKVQKDKRVVEEKEIVYKTIDTRVLHLDAFYRKSKHLNPAVVLVHGGGWKSGNKSQMESFGYALAAKGYSCFAVEYRLSPEAIYPAAVHDIKEAIQFIRMNALKYNIDLSKVAILGCSSGGQLAALIGTTNSKPDSNVQAIIDMDGILAFKHPESEEGKVASLWLGGEYEKIPETWKEASALTHVDHNTPPILFINSDMPRFHAGRNDMIEILNKYAIYYQVKTIPNAPHSFWFFDPWFATVVDYSNQFLKSIFNK